MPGAVLDKGTLIDKKYMFIFLLKKVSDRFFHPTLPIPAIQTFPLTLLLCTYFL